MKTIEELEKTIKRRDAKIKGQSKKIRDYKIANPKSIASEYHRLFNRYEKSEKELISREIEYLEEIEELKNEISELLQLVTIEEVK